MTMIAKLSLLLLSLRCVGAYGDDPICADRPMKVWVYLGGTQVFDKIRETYKDGSSFVKVMKNFQTTFPNLKWGLSMYGKRDKSQSPLSDHCYKPYVNFNDSEDHKISSVVDAMTKFESGSSSDTGSDAISGLPVIASESLWFEQDKANLFFSFADGSELYDSRKFSLAENEDQRDDLSGADPADTVRAIVAFFPEAPRYDPFSNTTDQLAGSKEQTGDAYKHASVCDREYKYLTKDRALADLKKSGIILKIATTSPNGEAWSQFVVEPSGKANVTVFDDYDSSAIEDHLKATIRDLSCQNLPSTTTTTPTSSSDTTEMTSDNTETSPDTRSTHSGDDSSSTATGKTTATGGGGGGDDKPSSSDRELDSKMIGIAVAIGCAVFIVLALLIYGLAYYTAPVWRSRANGGEEDHGI